MCTWSKAVTSYAIVVLQCLVLRVKILGNFFSSSHNQNTFISTVRYGTVLGHLFVFDFKSFWTQEVELPLMGQLFGPHGRVWLRSSSSNDRNVWPLVDKKFILYSYILKLCSLCRNSQATIQQWSWTNVDLWQCRRQRAAVKGYICGKKNPLTFCLCSIPKRLASWHVFAVFTVLLWVGSSVAQIPALQLGVSAREETQPGDCYDVVGRSLGKPSSLCEPVVL